MPMTAAKSTQPLKDEVLRVLWRKRQACAADLANELTEPMAAVDLQPIVTGLEREGVIRVVREAPGEDQNEPDPFQTVYEVVR